MNDLTCIIIGGGHAGLQALKVIKETTQGIAKDRRIRFVLIDKQPGHVRKILLFRPAVGEEEIMIPWTHWFPEGKEMRPLFLMTFLLWRLAASFGNRSPMRAASP